MLNELVSYIHEGRKAALARLHKDEYTAKSHSDYARRMMALETVEDRRKAQDAFDGAYRTVILGMPNR